RSPARKMLRVWCRPRDRGHRANGTTLPTRVGAARARGRRCTFAEMRGGRRMGARRARALRMGIGAAVGAAVLVVAVQAAQARVVTLRWPRPTPANVDGFRIHYGPSPGSYTNTIDAGRPAASGGVFSYNLSVGDNATVYVALTAYGAGFLESYPSNEKKLAP